MRRTILILSAILIPNAVVRAEAPASHEAIDASRPVVGTVQPATPEQLDPNVFHCGPILAKDPQTRTQIQGLYKQQWDRRQDTIARLKDLVARAQAETDPEARFALNKQGGQLKQDLMQRNMELGLEIARLNSDAPRVAEYETALDHLLHPEKYMPAMPSASEIQARRQRELGNTK